MEYFIYGLADPKTKKIYYIGKTINLKNRLAEHLTPANLKSKTLKNNWIKSLINKGQKPKIILLKITDCKNVDKLEKKYIKNIVK